MARILIIDDSKFQRKCLSRMLGAMGHEVTEAENGAIGLQVHEAVKPDIIISDLLMPVLDGIGLLRGLKEKGATTPVVVVTADIQECTREECLQLGAKALLNKPVTVAVLEAALGQFLPAQTGEKSPC